MTPTPRLRFVRRVEKFEVNGQEHVHIRYVLQQWYAYDIDYPTEKGEWKDVPLEKE